MGTIASRNLGYRNFEKDVDRLDTEIFSGDLPPGPIGTAAWNHIHLIPPSGADVTSYPVTDAGLADAIAAALVADSIIWVPPGTFTSPITIPANIGLIALGEKTTINAQINLSPGSFMESVVQSRSVSSGSAVSGVVGPASGAAYISDCSIVITNSGASDAYAANQSGGGTLWVWNCNLEGTASGGGAGYGINRTAGTVIRAGGWVKGSTADVNGTVKGFSLAETDADELKILGLVETKAPSASDVQYWRMVDSTGLIIGAILEASTANLGGNEFRGWRSGDDGAGALVRGVRDTGTSPAASPKHPAAIILEGAGSATNAEDNPDALPSNYKIVLILRRDGPTSGDPGNQIEVGYYAYDGDHYLSLGSYHTVEQFISTVAEGTPPLVVDSQTWIENLNADLLDGHHASDFLLGEGSIALTIAEIRSVTSPDIYATGIALGDLDATAGDELVMGSGSDLNGSPIDGTVTLFDADGNILWTYNSPNNDYALGVDVGDIDNDADYEVLVGFHIEDHIAVLLDNAGGFVWSFDNGATNYVRSVKIGELDGGSAGKEAVIGGRNGTLHLLDKDGNSIWSKTGVTSLCSPSCAGDSSDTVQSIEIADTDADAQNEIIIGYGATVKKFDYTGSQTWTQTVGDADSFVFGVSAGNVTGATGLEIAAAIANLGAGAINAVKLLDKDGNVLWTWNSSEPCWSVKIADVTGDGNNEIIVGHGTHIDASPPSLGTGGVTVLDSTGTSLGSIALPSSVKFVIFGDADNDGDDEIVASCDDGNVYILDITSPVVNTDEKAKVSSNDTTAGYLNGKLVAGSGITLAENNDGGNETLTINANVASVGQYRQLLWEVSGGTFTFLTDATGNPLEGLMDLE